VFPYVSVGLVHSFNGRADVPTPVRILRNPVSAEGGSVVSGTLSTFG
jgi:hypothetical protein